MRHFDFLAADELDRLFQLPPEGFSADDPATLGVGLGATLYCPATRPALAEDIVRRRADGAQSMVVCLEDSVPDNALAAAERNAIDQLRALASRDEQLPVIFVRVRAREQIAMIVDGLGTAASVLTGFVLPKFDEESGVDQLGDVVSAGAAVGRELYAMPVLECRSIAHAESRINSLLAVRNVIDKYRDIVPAVRVGATDISGVYGLRRAREMTVWDVRVVGDVISEIVNVFGRDGVGYPITGPVWEYYPSAERMFKPQLRETPFIKHDERTLRAELLAADLDGLIREVVLDRANGLIGKTVIHPTHVAAVNALSVVSAEEYSDASDIAATGAQGGSSASSFGNKMNESKPHTVWARRVLARARVFGVARPGVSFVDLLGASLRR